VQVLGDNGSMEFGVQKKSLGSQQEHFWWRTLSEIVLYQRCLSAYSAKSYFG